MRHLAHKTYLIGQCSKLAQSSELAVYLKGDGDKRKPLPANFWQVLQCPPEIDQTAAFSDAAYAERFFNQLPETELASLTKAFDLHHINGVFDNIQRHSSWEMVEFQMEEVEVSDLEGELKDAILRNNRELLRVARDPDFLANKNYKYRDLLMGVPYGVFLGKPKKAKIRLMDGNHRAIHRARQFIEGCNQDKTLTIVVPSDWRKLTER